MSLFGKKNAEPKFEYDPNRHKAVLKCAYVTVNRLRDLKIPRLGNFKKLCWYVVGGILTHLWKCMILVPSQRSINSIWRELSVLEGLSHDIMEELKYLWLCAYFKSFTVMEIVKNFRIKDNDMQLRNVLIEVGTPVNYKMIFSLLINTKSRQEKTFLLIRS